MAQRITKRTWVFGFEYSPTYIIVRVRRGSRKGAIWTHQKVHRPNVVQKWLGVTWEQKLRRAVQELKVQTKIWDDSWRQECKDTEQAKRVATEALKWI